jgi:endothelin-converting enzyme
MGQITIPNPDNGWLKAHPLPAEKSSYGTFEELAQQNKQVIQQILESSDKLGDPYDREILQKLRDMYSSCLNESVLDDIGNAPLEHYVETIRKLFREEDSEIGSQEGKRESKGLTAALAFIHSRGMNRVQPHIPGSMISSFDRHRFLVLLRS